MTFDVGRFRTAFPEFANPATYPNEMIDFWVGLAEKLVRPCIWNTCWQQGMSLYIAHVITLARENVQAANVGGTPGSSGGIANNKTVGSVTVGFDSQSTAEKDAGWWNLTTYGKQFIRLARIFGAGAIQL